MKLNWNFQRGGGGGLEEGDNEYEFIVPFKA